MAAKIEINERGNHVFRNADADVRMGGSGGDRYQFDFDLCGGDKGWSQFDTTQDAWYFGAWVNIAERKTFCYCEGDRILVVCPTIESFRAELEDMVNFYGDAPPAFIAIADGQITKYYDQRPMA